MSSPGSKQSAAVASCVEEGWQHSSENDVYIRSWNISFWTFFKSILFRVNCCWLEFWKLQCYIPAIHRPLPLQLTTWISSLAWKLRCQTRMMCPSQVRVPAVPWDLHLLKLSQCRLQAKYVRQWLCLSINSLSTETTIHVFKEATSRYLLLKKAWACPQINWIPRKKHPILSLKLFPVVCCKGW